MHISIAAEPLFSFLGLTITNSLVSSWLVALALVMFSIYFFYTVKLSLVPGKLQNFVELIVEGFYGLIREIAGEKAKVILPILASFFIFILGLNWFGLFPGVGSIGIWETGEHGKELVPILRGGTADLNTTLALAIFSIAAVQIYGIKFLGAGKFLKRYINLSNPINFFVGILEVFSEVSKVISFSFRLFGNIFAGEVLLTVMIFLVPLVVPTIFLGLEVFVGLIQALIFMMLTLIFISAASESHDEDEEKHGKIKTVKPIEAN